MTRDVQQPIVKDSPHKHVDQELSHPAFAQIRASRVTGGAILYGSDFRHQNYVTVSIHASLLNRSLSRDRVWGIH